MPLTGRGHRKPFGALSRRFGRVAVETRARAVRGRHLAADLLPGLADLVHPNGSIDTAGSVSHYVLAFREMARRLSTTGFTGRAADLRRPHLTGYRMGTTANRESCTRWALEAFARDGGTIDPGVAKVVAGRNFNLSLAAGISSRRMPTARR